jgi:RES domain-containing protein
MPEAWRIVRAEHAAGAFSGEGAAKTGGRWNSRGVAVVYTSATRSLAALETLVHLNPPMSFKYRIIRIEFAGELVRHLRPALPSDWRTSPAPDSTRKLGDAWVREAHSAILAVPSIIIPDETNFVLNPAHPDFKRIRLGRPTDFVFDSRLLR